MKEFKDKVAVVSGSASGIERAMAERFAAEGMNVVLADIEEKALETAESEMKAKGAKVLGIQTDVSKANDIEALAQKTLDAFGAVHVLCNNAGVVTDPSKGWRIWENTIDDWEWVIGVNLWGVIHGIRVFVPIMLQGDTECHIVNTASTAGLTSTPYVGIYNVTKHGVVALSETLHRELTLKGAKVKVSVLCPGWVKTKIGNAARNRPPELQTLPPDKTPDSEDEMQHLGSYLSALYERYEPSIRQQLQEELSPEQVADMVFRAVRDEQFYIFTHPGIMENWVRNRMEDIQEKHNPDIFL